VAGQLDGNVFLASEAGSETLTSSGDAIFRLHRGSLSEIGMFDLKKQLFYLVFLEPV